MGQQASGGGGEKGGNPLLSFLPLVLIIVIMWLLLLRPQAKRQKQHRQMLENLQKGDRVMTAGGLLGTVAGIKEKENTLIIKLADNMKVEVARNMISQVLNQKTE
jgi:preprotein translocase subunit YajC